MKIFDDEYPEKPEISLVEYYPCRNRKELEQREAYIICKCKVMERRRGLEYNGYCVNRAIPLHGIDVQDVLAHIHGRPCKMHETFEEKEMKEEQMIQIKCAEMNVEPEKVLTLDIS